jgi:hypothetical protein
MRLTELQLSTDLRDERYSPMLILKKYGWKILGSGIYGTVADHPTKPYVLLDDVWRKIKRQPDPAWIDITTKLIAATTKSYLDLHSGNFMLRGTTLVIIDPWSD